MSVARSFTIPKLARAPLEKFAEVVCPPGLHEMDLLPQLMDELELYLGAMPGPARLGILTGADLREWSLPALEAQFGSSGRWYWRICRGIDEREVKPDRPYKSVSAERTFEKKPGLTEDGMRELIARRKETQPIGEWSCGSTFTLRRCRKTSRNAWPSWPGAG